MYDWLIAVRSRIASHRPFPLSVPLQTPTPGNLGGRLLALALGSVLAVDPALAAESAPAFCESALVTTIGNLFTVIQLGGPLVGGVIALGATVAVPAVRRSDLKRELKEARNQGVVWGVLVAPLGTTIIQFLLTHVVAGGSSCGL
jgi:hypothetical protein